MLEACNCKADASSDQLLLGSLSLTVDDLVLLKKPGKQLHASNDELWLSGVNWGPDEKVDNLVRIAVVLEGSNQKE
jgi:hypothetical protein